MMVSESRTLSNLLDALEDAGSGETVSLSDVLKEIGSRSFAALILVPSLILISPLSGVLGLPTIGAAIMFLVALQKLLRRPHIWLPDVLKRRKVQSKRLLKATSWLRPVANWGDKHTHKRLRWLTTEPANLLALLVIMAICLVIPMLEVLPFVTSVFAVAISLFSVGFLARDGLFTLLGYTQVVLSFGVVRYMVG
ncbi:exopolysaccharide biosynthesis protein [Lentibacter sp. XHP0401]|jgi:hypothetical protein|uniref:exopolysaccharide biosynthesis protein n=1 Tax=Lentibacter sp. XHP0401 TaxID=2984334 RepID=UPI0021E7C963|nr:exopolysaccharide biosynthesis protein [Lentibacter sp. XHP0401]MCV2892504.1 exopolysaccharide biosynthesis protein [Lentibacter sp. XHP0401]